MMATLSTSTLFHTVMLMGVAMRILVLWIAALRDQKSLIALKTMVVARFLSEWFGQGPVIMRP